jgi:hypothetical protein
MNLFKRIDILYIVTLLFLLLASNANFLDANIYWIPIEVFMFVVAIARRSLGFKDVKVIGVFAICYLLFVGVRDIFINNLEVDYLLSDVFFLLKYVFLSFIFCVILKEKVATYLVKVAIPLIIISLIFFVFQLLGFGHNIYLLSEALHLPSQGVASDEYANFLFYTYVGIHEFRNSGFFWEPGVFACFLIIVLLLNLFLNKFKFDTNSKIIIIGLISTVSTTGYLALLLVFFLWYRYKVPQIKMGVLVVIGLSIVLIFTIPFLGDKITGVFKEDMEQLQPKKLTDAQRYLSHAQDKQIHVNRFASMILIYNTFGEDLILGVSNDYDVILNKTYSVNTSNGIFDFMAKFGLVGYLFVLYRYSRFCMAYLGRAELLIYSIIAFLIICTGEPIVHLGFVLMFLFIPLAQQPGTTINRSGLNRVK